MNFELDEAQRVIAASAAEVLREADAAATWQALAKAGLLALTLPGWMGGDGLGVGAAAVLLTEVGRRRAQVPALATIMLGALPVVRWGSRELQERVLVGVGAGETILTAGVRERSTGWPAIPATVAVPGGAGQGTVTGTKIGVPYAAEATWILIPAAVPADAGPDGTDGPALRASRAVVVVAPSGPGVTLVRTPSSSGTPEYTVRLEAAPIAGVLGADGVAGTTGVAWAEARSGEPREAAVDDLHLLAAAGAAAVADGAVAGALDLTAKYIAGREQFGRPLATFQAVAGQAADVYIAGRTLHLAALSACWRLSAGLDATEDAGVAAYWLASEAPAALRTCHQLHGGIGLDISYPLHRYSAMINDLARFVGGADCRLGVLATDDSQKLEISRPIPLAGDHDYGLRSAGAAPAGMFIALTGAQLALRDELRAYFAGLISPAEREAMQTDRHGKVYRQLIRRLGSDGWLGVGWPAEFGGRGLGQVEQQIFVSEAARADVPLPSVTLQTVGPTLQEYGTAEQKATFLPRIIAGEVHFAIGYTEPGAGTDLAALTTRAVRDGDEYVVNGQKIFTTGAHDADYIWLACRTDPDAPKHKGISILIVDTTDPGFSWTPIITCDGAHHVNATYYTDVRVPVSMRVGAENEGWRLVTTQLNHERVMLGPAGRLGVLHDRIRRWASAARGPDGHPIADQPDARRALAEVGASLRVNELLNWQVAASETVEIADASATKVFSSERIQRLGQLLIDIVGRHADPADEAAADLMTWLDVQHKRNLVLTFGGGVNEVQRELIAVAGLRLPRVPR
jgi:3-oxo-4-pregnene-20-carboxyl-CoA dehydrogenase beta subunit